MKSKGTPNKLPGRTPQLESDNWSLSPDISTSCSKVNVLLIASDRAQGTCLGDLLRSEGFAVDVSSGLPLRTDSIAAIALVAGYSSRQIERMYEMCLAIRNVAPRLPLIVVGPNDIEVKVRFFRLEADDYLDEPVNRTELIARIGSSIRRLGPRF